MLNRNEFRSLWEIAYRWEGIEPPEEEPSELPEGVIDKIDKLIWGVRRERISLRHPSSLLVNPSRTNWFDLFIIDRTYLRLLYYHFRRKFPRAFLDRLYIMRPDLLEWCARERKEPPAFWWPAEGEALLSGPVPDSGKVPVGRHKNEEVDRQLSQAVARTLWAIDPSIHPAHMAKSKAIRLYANGDSYKGKDHEYDTVKKWIREVDPLREQRRPGNPGKVKYLIDLETLSLRRD